MRSFKKLTIVQTKLFMREPIALFFTLAFPALLLILFGAIFGNAPDPAYNGYGYLDAQVPGLTGIIIGTVALLSIPIATATAREQKVLRRYQATPMRPAVYLAADVVVNFVIALGGMLMLVLIAELVFGLRFGGNWLAVLGGFSLCTLAFMAVGYVLASLAPTARFAQVVGQVIFFPMMFLSGAAMPLEIMPENVRQFAEWMPLTHVVALLRELWFGGGWDLTAVAVMAGLLLAGVALSARTFRWE